jgi:hypothetical protein
MFEESINYKNTDVLLMDPCYSRDDDNDIDSELYCSDLVVDTCQMAITMLSRVVSRI